MTKFEKVKKFVKEHWIEGLVLAVGIGCTAAIGYSAYKDQKDKKEEPAPALPLASGDDDWMKDYPFGPNDLFNITIERETDKRKWRVNDDTYYGSYFMDCNDPEDFVEIIDQPEEDNPIAE